MAVELRFSRLDSSISWGFRLTGGADLNVPLTVIKVEDNSIAEEVGMKVGDLLVRVNDTPTAGLTHLQVHDLIKEAKNKFIAAVIRGELPSQVRETDQTIDSKTTQDGVSQSLQINIKANVVDTTQIVVESGEEYIQNDIKINGSLVSDKEEQNVEFTINREGRISEEVSVKKSSEETRSEMTEYQATQIKDELSLNLEKLTQTPEYMKDSEVLKVINEEEKQEKEIKEDKMKQEKRWTTFLQKPDRPKPKLKQKEDDEPKEPPYRVKIQKQKKKRDADKAAAAAAAAAAAVEEAKRLAEASQETSPLSAEMMSETPEVSEQQEEKTEEEQEEKEGVGESKQQVEQVEDAVISEVEMSLEEQLAAIQKQLLALSQLPAAIQQTLDVVTQQLDKIVGPVNDPNTEENDSRDESQEETLDDTEQETDFGERTGELETLEEVSESGFDRDSQQGEDSEKILEGGDFDKLEPELEMLQATPEPEENLTPEERDKMDKKHKIAHWNDIWPWGNKLGRKIYRDTNTHLVSSKAIESNKINFLKYQPPPKTLDHLKHSEVFRLVHDMDQPVRGVGARAGKAMAEEDYFAQARKSEPEGQMKG